FYEVLWSLGAIGVFLLLARKRRPAGFYAALLPILYTPVRFFLDYLRAEPAEGGDVRYMGFTPGQYASLAMLLFGFWLMWWVHRHPAPELPPSARWPEPSNDTGAAKASSPPARKGKRRAG